MKHLCIKCHREVQPRERTITVRGADRMLWYIHPRCFVPADWREKSERLFKEKNPLPERDIRPTKERSGPRPRVVKTRIEERDGRTFKVAVLPEVKPDPKRTQKTIYRLFPGDVGFEKKKRRNA